MSTSVQLRLPGFLQPTEHPARCGKEFSFIDLFAGIGGFRLGLQAVGGECVFSSERDKFARRTYREFFGEHSDERFNNEDINKIDPGDIPDHDLLAAGFPCQPFSVAGVSKKKSLGQAHGFECERQGNLFFRICEIAAAKRPQVLFLENVKNLRSHDGGTTWTVIEQELEQLDYWIFDKTVDAAGYVPQHRERVFIVCFDRQVFDQLPDFRWPAEPDRNARTFDDIRVPDPPEKYHLSEDLWQYLQNYAEKHRAKGNGFGYGIAPGDGVTRTLSARYHKDGSEILVEEDGKPTPRRLTIVEAAHLMGFDEVVNTGEEITVSDTQAYRQFGNSVVPKVVEAIAHQITAVMMDRPRAGSDRE